MDVFYKIIFFILGITLGSFYTVVGQRLPRGENFVSGRSRCDSCNKTLKYYELIPLFSFFLQKGKCRECGSKIDLLLPFMEVACGLLFLVSFHSFGFSLDLLIALGIVSLLIIVLVSDLTYLIIPDKLLVFFSIYFIIVQIFRVGIVDTLIQIGIGVFLFSIMYLIMLIGNMAFKRESLGGGDIKLMFLFGLVLDPLLGVLTIFLGSLFAMPTAIYLHIKNDEKILPFGPFLIMAFAFIFFMKISANDFVTFLGF